MPCATCTVKTGFMKAPAKPCARACEYDGYTSYGVKALARHSDTKIGMKGIVSSAMPNTEPQMEKNNITIGMIKIDAFFIALINLPMPASIDLVS